MWPQVHMNLFGVEFDWSLRGYEVLKDKTTGEVLIGGGLGYFISYEVGSFLAQCINFPLQRNITFKSKGNPVYQAMWYFIAWVVILPDLQRIQQPVDADRAAVCGSGDL